MALTVLIGIGVLAGALLALGLAFYVVMEYGEQIMVGVIVCIVVGLVLMIGFVVQGQEPPGWLVIGMMSTLGVGMFVVMGDF